MTITVDNAVKMVKPFLGSFGKKNHVPERRKVLKTAFIKNNKVIALEPNGTIMITLDIEKTDSFKLHHYKPELSEKYTWKDFPKTEKLIPNKYDANKAITINVKEWIEIHEAALPASKQWENKVVRLENDNIRVKPNEALDVFGQVEFQHKLVPTDIEVAYNCEYMLMMLKLAKKLKQKEVDMYYFGKHRPMLFEAEDMEVLIMPIRLV